MRMSVERMAVRMSPPARRLPWTSNRLAHVADQDAVQPAVEPAEAGLARGLPEGRLEQVPVEPDLIAGVQDAAAEPAGPQERLGVGVRGFRAAKSGSR